MNTDKQNIIVDALTTKIAMLTAELDVAKAAVDESQSMARAAIGASAAVDSMSERSATLLRSFIINKHPKLLPELAEYVVDTVEYKMTKEKHRFDIGGLALQHVVDSASTESDKKQCIATLDRLERLSDESTETTDE